jgi:chaperonin GroES
MGSRRGCSAPRGAADEPEDAGRCLSAQAAAIGGAFGRPRLVWLTNACHESKRGRLFMNLQPLGDRLIVEVLEEEDMTASGIVLPDTAREKPQRGRVLAVGPGPRDEDGEYIKMDVEEGDEIIFSKYGGTEIRLGTDEVLILRESDVLAKVVGDREPVGAKA